MCIHDIACHYVEITYLDCPTKQFGILLLIIQYDAQFLTSILLDMLCITLKFTTVKVIFVQINFATQIHMAFICFVFYGLFRIYVLFLSKYASFLYSWVQSQLKNHPDEIWEDGIRDYLAHASNIMVIP